MKRRILVILALIFTASAIQAQGTYGYRPGYVINYAHDTLNGFIKIDSWKRIKFKKELTKKSKKYSTNDLAGFERDAFNFVALNILGLPKKHFARVVAEGYLNLYEFTYRQLINYGSFRRARYYDGYFLKTDDKDFVFYPHIGTETQNTEMLQEFFKDDSTVCKRLDKYDYGNLTSSYIFAPISQNFYRLVSDYNVRKYKPQVPKSSRTGTAVFFKEMNKDSTGFFLTVNDSSDYSMDGKIIQPVEICYGKKGCQECVLIAALPGIPIYVELYGSRYGIKIDPTLASDAQQRITYIRRRAMPPH
jgi:hypothetical protein